MKEMILSCGVEGDGPHHLEAVAQVFLASFLAKVLWTCFPAKMHHHTFPVT